LLWHGSVSPGSVSHGASSKHASSNRLANDMFGTTEMLKKVFLMVSFRRLTNDWIRSHICLCS